MPEAPVDEDDGAVLRQNQVRRAGQIAAVEAESVPQPVDEASDRDLGPRVRCLHACHDGASLFGRVRVAHLAEAFPERFSRASSISAKRVCAKSSSLRAWVSRVRRSPWDTLRSRITLASRAMVLARRSIRTSG